MHLPNMNLCIILGIPVLIYSVYFITLSSSIAGGDSGELVAEGCILGVAHPPGYPLYTILVYLLSRLPFGTVAFRVNAFSALCTTVAATALGAAVFKTSKHKQFVGSVFAMGMFSFSPLVWQYAVSAEVFPLNTMFASMILLLTILFTLERQVWMALSGAFLCGLACCNQHTIILYEVPLVLWMLWLMRHLLIAKPVIFPSLLFTFLLGILGYIYLPLTSSLNPRAGSWGDVTSISGFLHHFLRRDYGTFRLFSGASGKNTEGMWYRTNAYVRDIFFVQGLYVVPILAVIGALLWRIAVRVETVDVENKDARLVDTKKKTKKDSKKNVNPSETVMQSESAASTASQPAKLPLAFFLPEPLVSVQDTRFLPLALLATQTFYFAVFHSLSNLPMTDRLLYGIHQRFWMQPNVLLFMWAGIGVDIAVDFLVFLCSAATSEMEKSINYNSRAKINCYIFAYSCVCMTVGCQLWKWYPVSDQSQAMHFNRYASALLAPLPQSAVLLINYDMQWTALRYMQQCEGHRADVTTINLSMMTYHWFASKHASYPTLRFPGNFHAAPNSPYLTQYKAFTMHQFVTANLSPSKPIFIGGKFSYDDKAFFVDYEVVPFGLVSAITPRKSLPSAAEYLRTNNRNWKRVFEALPELPDPVKYPEETWEWTIGRDFKDRVVETAAFMLQIAISSISEDPQPLVEAVYWLETALLLETTAHTPGPAPAALLKNLGLGHLHLIQTKNPALLSSLALPLPSVDHFKSVPRIQWPGEKWKDWCSERWIFAWGGFLNHTDAKSDPQFGTIRKMYDSVLGTSKQKPGASKKKKKLM